MCVVPPADLNSEHQSNMGLSGSRSIVQKQKRNRHNWSVGYSKPTLHCCRGLALSYLHKISSIRPWLEMLVHTVAVDELLDVSAGIEGVQQGGRCRSCHSL